MEIQQSQEENVNLSQHEQAMVDKMDANTNQTQQELQSDADRRGVADDAPLPSDEVKLYAGKYKSVEDMEQAYKELEGKLGSNDGETKEASTEAEEGDTVSTEAEAKELAESKGIDFTELNQEFANNGVLSEDTYASLAGKGIDKATVDNYIAGQEAIVSQNLSKMQSLAGGEQGYQDMISWAGETLSDGDKEAFNSSLQNEGQAEFAIQGLYARFQATLGPSLVKASSNSTTSSQGYQSSQEMTKDMHDVRYKKDPAFRAQVQNKIAKSNW